jgi:plastocyanin
MSITNFVLTPATLTVPVGATVTWTNHDAEPHTVAANGASFHSPGLGTNSCTPLRFRPRDASTTSARFTRSCTAPWW